MRSQSLILVELFAICNKILLSKMKREKSISVDEDIQRESITISENACGIWREVENVIFWGEKFNFVGPECFHYNGLDFGVKSHIIICTTILRRKMKFEVALPIWLSFLLRNSEFTLEISEDEFLREKITGS